MTLVGIGVVMVVIPITVAALAIVIVWLDALRAVIRGGPDVDREAAGAVVLLGWIVMGTMIVIVGSGWR